MKLSQEDDCDKMMEYRFVNQKLMESTKNTVKLFFLTSEQFHSSMNSSTRIHFP